MIGGLGLRRFSHLELEYSREASRCYGGYGNGTGAFCAQDQMRVVETDESIERMCGYNARPSGYSRQSCCILLAGFGRFLSVEIQEHFLRARSSNCLNRGESLHCRFNCMYLPACGFHMFSATSVSVWRYFYDMLYSDLIPIAAWPALEHLPRLDRVSDTLLLSSHSAASESAITKDKPLPQISILAADCDIVIQSA